MVSGRGWKRNGGGPSLAGVARKGGGLSACDFPPSTQAPDGFGFPRWRRLARSSDIQRVGREGRRIRGTNLELRFTAAALGHARVGIIVPRHGRPVVERNRVRRLLREHLRTALMKSIPETDLLIRVLPSAYATAADVLRRELGELSAKIGELDKL